MKDLKDWVDIKVASPPKPGWYKVKTIHGELEAPVSKQFNGELVWVVPDDSIITHWKEK